MWNCESPLRVCGRALTKSYFCREVFGHARHLFWLQRWIVNFLPRGLSAGVSANGGKQAFSVRPETMRALPLLAAAFMDGGCSLPRQLPIQTASLDGCVPFGGVSKNQRWLKGDYTVVPVAPYHQRGVMHRLIRGEVQAVNPVVANAMSADANVPEAAHYYLARVGYVGDTAAGVIPAGMSFSVDVDTDGAAYVSSFVLSRSTKTSELGVILASPTPIKQVVSSCGAAE